MMSPDELTYHKGCIRSEFDGSTMSDAFDLIDRVKGWDNPELRELVAEMEQDIQTDIDNYEAKHGRKPLIRKGFIGQINYEGNL